MTTKIEWCDETWNPITGCSAISAGCKNCYAANLIKRFGKIWGYDFTPTFHPDRLDIPAKWKTPRKIFVCSMGDLFHKDVPYLSDLPEASTLYQIFSAMRRAPQHTYMILTKRPKNMADYIIARDDLDHFKRKIPNLWLGVTVEDTDNLWRVKELLKLRSYAKVLFVSVEPMMGPVDLYRYVTSFCGCGLTNDACDDWKEFGECDVGPPRLDLVICGPETGAGKRELREEWAIDLRDQCKAVAVPFFYTGGKLAGETYEEFPEV